MSESANRNLVESASDLPVEPMELADELTGDCGRRFVFMAQNDGRLALAAEPAAKPPPCSRCRRKCRAREEFESKTAPSGFDL